MSLACIYFPLVQLASKLGCENCFSVCQFFSIVAKLRTPTGLIKPCRLFVKSAAESERSFSTFFSFGILSKDFHKIVKDRSLDTTIVFSIFVEMFLIIISILCNISPSADGGSRFRVCARLTLRSAPHRH